jgi:hypothetical protein
MEIPKASFFLMLGLLAPVAAVSRPGLMRHEASVDEPHPSKMQVTDQVLPLEDHYHALLLAVPLVITNLTNYSGLISVGGAFSPGMSHKFGNIESDKALLLSMTHGLYSLMQEISDDSRQACPLNSAESATHCLGKALCLIQSQVDTVKNKSELQQYSLWEEMYSRFNHISWPKVASKLDLNHDQTNTASLGYATPSQHSCHGTYNEMSGNLLETASSADRSSAKAAAYRTSATLLGAAKTTHAVIDSHTHNSSVHETLAALHEAWEPACKLLECDATNYLDFFRASHSHSMALMEVGASAHHMQVHIRTRQRLDLRMQEFLGEHGEDFQPHILRNEDSDPRFRAAAKQYFARSRGSFMQFAIEYPKKHAANLNKYPLSLVDTERMEEFFEAHGKQHLLKVLRSKEGFIQIEDEHSDGDSMALVEELEEGEDEQEVEDEHEDAETEGKGGKGFFWKSWQRYKKAR